MDSCEKFILENNLFNKGDRIGVGCSGGGDSLALLYYLCQNKDRFGIEVVAIHLDHNIRKNSHIDFQFVEKKAREFGADFIGFCEDVPSLAKKSGQSLETEGREVRYNIFRKLLKEGRVDKIALAHHKSDQAETILMHLFRGSGLTGARGMEPSKDNFIRPFLNTSKEEILEYLLEKNLSFVEDYTNSDNSYNRNYLRNVVFKDIIERWPNAIDSIVNFGSLAKEDDEFIYSQVQDKIFFEKDNVKVPLLVLEKSPSIVSRVFFSAVKALGVTKDFERKHIQLIINLGEKGKNGDGLSLPFGLTVIKEYDYLTIFKESESLSFSIPFKEGIINVPNYGIITTEKTDKIVLGNSALYIDGDKVPTTAVWRLRKEGDLFTKFGGGTKKLKDYLIDEKVPLRLRDSLPLLADGKNILVIAGMEISQHVKVEDKSINIYKVQIKR